MLFGLRLEPSIIEFRVWMTDLLQTVFFPFNLWKNYPKYLGKVIKILKIIFSSFEKDFFEKLLCLDDLGHDHDLLK